MNKPEHYSPLYDYLQTYALDTEGNRSTIASGIELCTSSRVHGQTLARERSRVTTTLDNMLGFPAQMMNQSLLDKFPDSMRNFLLYRGVTEQIEKNGLYEELRQLMEELPTNPEYADALEQVRKVTDHHKLIVGATIGHLRHIVEVSGEAKLQEFYARLEPHISSIYR